MDAELQAVHAEAMYRIQRYQPDTLDPTRQEDPHYGNTR